MSTKKACVYMVGAFPPPLHGMSAVNATMSSLLSESAESVRVFNTSASSLSRSLFARLVRLPRVLRGLLWILGARIRDGDALYMSVSGGYGQMYEILFLCIARIKGLRIFLHHHCFAYLDQRSALTSLLVRVAGDGAAHIVLSERMGMRLVHAYPGAARWRSLSNAAFLPEAVRQECLRPNLSVMGFLGNICREKGVFDFLDLCGAVQAEMLPVSACIAGPFQDSETEAMVLGRLEVLPNVTYIGPVYGGQKAAFFSGIDVLLFPTRYVNEAEPLTIHEAMQSEVPVIAYGRGAIAEIVPHGAGLVVDVDGAFVDVALKQIRRWLRSDDAYRVTSRAAGEAFDASRSRANDALRALTDEITSIPGSVAVG